jgi:hypothetical protein
MESIAVTHLLARRHPADQLKADDVAGENSPVMDVLNPDGEAMTERGFPGYGGMSADRKQPVERSRKKARGCRNQICADEFANDERPTTRIDFGYPIGTATWKDSPLW